MSKHLSQIKAYAKRRNLPLIPVQANDITLLKDPSSFYQTILEKAKTSKQRLALSALYIGTGSKEEAIIHTILENLKKNNHLVVEIALDANRANRLDNVGESSVTIMEELLNYNSVNLNLVQTVEASSIVGRLIRGRQKLSEVLSTYHAKFMVFDDSVLLTGANLSSIYFEQRQDRYMLLQDSKTLADYLLHLIDRLGAGRSLRDTIREYNSSFIERLDRTSGNMDGADSFVIPLMQHGPSGLTDKEDFLKFLSTTLSDNIKIHASTGYFNPSSIVDSLRLSSVLAPSESANGFHGGSGALKYVPRLYSAIYKRYLDRHPECELNLYDRPDWSFHAKGIWFEGDDEFYMHLLGSSNYNHRSADRDFETQLLLLTKNKGLIRKLEAERTTLWRDSTPVRARDLTGLNWLYHAASRLLRSFL